MKDTTDDDSVIDALKAEVDEAWKKVQEARDRESDLQATIDQLKVGASCGVPSYACFWCLVYLFARVGSNRYNSRHHVRYVCYD